MLWCSVVLLALFASVQGRAINISNTWVLPEEGFPVFYRYFRDRISWYEADAVCQFHHANLVTVDTTAQYDAVRAYLKELDISSAVWVGLIRSNPEGEFTWTDYRGLSGDGYWSSAPDERAAPLCAAADPAADYRWEARNCGGPTVAAFICELPVPQWALGNEGCMVRALPALTVLYLPESAAVQLTADCGLAGVKRVQCTGNVKRENLLRDLSCIEEEETSSTSIITSTSVSGPLTTDTTFTDQDNSNGSIEETTTADHTDDANQSKLIKATPIPYNINANLQDTLQINQQLNLKINRIVDKNNYHDNNLQSNDIPKIVNDEEDSLMNEQAKKLEDEKLMQHKMLHEELARLGNFETIFTQPTDHFVPPLVMAKAKISDDMTVLSLKEKHAQQLAEQHFMKQNVLNEQNDQPHIEINYSTTSEATNRDKSTAKPLVTTLRPTNVKDHEKKEAKVKTVIPKKYNEKYNDPKSKSTKTTENKAVKIEKTTDVSPSTSTFKNIETTVPKAVYDNNQNKTDEDPTIDLTVIIKEPGMDSGEKVFYSNYSGDVPKIEIIQSDAFPKTNVEVTSTEVNKVETEFETTTKTLTEIEHNYTTLNHQVIKITIIKDTDSDSSASPTTFEITTKFPDFEDKEKQTSTPQEPIHAARNNNEGTNNQFINMSTYESTKVVQEGSKSTTEKNVPTTSVTTKAHADTGIIKETMDSAAHITFTTTTATPVASTETVIAYGNNVVVKNASRPFTSTAATILNNTAENNESVEMYNMTDGHDEEHVEYATDTSETIDDFQSPLLSGANEPLHRPPRSRRPQSQPNRIKKFNPFRILG